MASAFNAQSDPGVVFKFFSASQQCKHQYCCAWDCILQILFSSYQISLSLNQSFVAKIRSISISSPCHFYLCYTVLYNFLGLRFATVGAKRTSTGCPAPLYLPLSEFINTDGTI